MKLYIDIDGTICTKADINSPYDDSIPIPERIEKINKRFYQGDTITYWTARGSASGKNYEELTRSQLSSWGCKYHSLLFGKPDYDLYIDDKSHNVENFWPIQEKKVITKPTKVLKGWGYELILENNEHYCGKILHFNKGAKFSMHYHIQKKETWYVQSGKFLFRSIQTETADVAEYTLQEGECVTNERGQPHQIECLEDGDIFEVSTQHFDSDSYRVWKGDSQRV
jgi:mannose-6-phosphate isomerase-like protein (cupin superfamily)